MQTRPGRNIDDAPPARPLQGGDRSAADDEGRMDIGAKYAVPILEIYLFDRTERDAQRTACIVDDDVDASRLVLDGFDPIGCGGAVTQVNGSRGNRHGGSKLVQSVLRNVAAKDLSAAVMKSFGDCSPK